MGPILQSEESILHATQNVILSFNSQTPQGFGLGSLYITTQNVIWLSQQDPQLGYSMDYYFISLHAIARSPGTFSSPCIYCHLDISEDQSEETPITEAFLAPQDPSTLDEIYGAMSHGASLNPDPVEEGEGDFFYGGEEDEIDEAVFQNDSADDDEDAAMNDE
eukprot:TRINITY_DN11710_c0_g1_i1.p1 TRINITY_DN11710_c0_g1~~TRINITY_DN11710_c0_g1_i1.p1  ORF type:complete len:179 (+),score=57.47 TRINITY_DN11710_c0_g1_i1:51-539(+)